jgi:hypothetical protein
MKYVVALTGTLLALALAVPTPADAGDYRTGSGFKHGGGFNNCHYKCPPPKQYDSQEIVKTSKEVDHSKVIETQTVVPSKRLIETNHLVIHEHETVNKGVVLHKNIIIEKELVLTKRNVDHKHVNKVVDLVEHKFETDRRRVVEEKEIPGVVRDLKDCECPPFKKPLGVHAYGEAPKYVSSRY